MAYREFQDETGHLWTVWDTYPEWPNRAGMADLQSGWICFESGGERRRLVPAPVGWVEAPVGQLREWLERAAPAKLRLGDYESETDTALPVARDDARSEELP